jgi:hypothetical protein
MNLNWTTEKPTVPGWYWMQAGDKEPEIVRVCARENGGLELRDIGYWIHSWFLDGPWRGVRWSHTAVPETKEPN